MDRTKGRFLLNIEAILRSEPQQPSTESPDTLPDFPAFFVSSTAPNNVEDRAGDVLDPEPVIQQIADFLNKQEKPEILVVIHGYNTALGSFSYEYDLHLRSPSAQPISKEDRRKKHIEVTKDNQNALRFRIVNDRGKKTFDVPEAALAPDKNIELEALKALLQPYWDKGSSAITSEVKAQIIDKVTAITNNTYLNAGVKGWYEDIRNYIATHCPNKSKGLVLIGYRWPSEQINGIGKDSLCKKFEYALASLPTALKVVAAFAFIALVGLIVASLKSELPGLVAFGIAGVSLLVLATVAISTVSTLFLLRIAGYFRDSYRATNFGVPELVEFFRQLDQAVGEARNKETKPDLPILNQALEEINQAVGEIRKQGTEPDLSTLNQALEEINQAAGKIRDNFAPRIKLSFIGHSMGGFVVTNMVRVLSDVFDRESIGKTNLRGDNAKRPSPNIGNVFCLGRLVLVAPDIPAEAIITSRANFLSSSLRRFEEAYLFSNEGDMALKLASTAANYASFPARTREGGYRLGNVVVRLPDNSDVKQPKASKTYGIVNVDLQTGQLIEKLSFLTYLYILDRKSLLERQITLLGAEQKPIAELFTVFDCTDYKEPALDKLKENQRQIRVLSHALGKRSLNFLDYARLTIDYFRGKIETHGGYFNDGKTRKPEAELTKKLVYGLACLGFKNFLMSLEEHSSPAPEPTFQEQKHKALCTLSNLCKDQGIEVLLSPERYNRDVSGILPR
jgi:hypothetical protein